MSNFSRDPQAGRCNSGGEGHAIRLWKPELRPMICCRQPVLEALRQHTLDCSRQENGSVLRLGDDGDGWLGHPESIAVQLNLP
jgi:hypothetical protein